MDAPSYSYYQGTGGKLSQEAFDELCPKAKAHVDWLIGWKDVPQEHEEAYLTAVCFAVDAFAEYGSSGLGDGGFSIGSFRVDGSSGFVASGKDAATDAAWEVLAPTGLLWSGVC